MNPTLFDISPLETSALKLNDAQRRAITHGSGPLLVIAGAGTGKTRVITERIRHLLDSDPALGGENILALTYTKKAAGEMKSRIVKTCGERGRDVKIFTFHAFCEEILRENGAKYAVHKDIRDDNATLKIDWQVSEHATLTSVTGFDYGRWYTKSDDGGLPITARLDLSQADLLLDSLADVALPDLLERMSRL